APLDAGVRAGFAPHGRGEVARAMARLGARAIHRGVRHLVARRVLLPPDAALQADPRILLRYRVGQALRLDAVLAARGAADRLHLRAHLGDGPRVPARLGELRRAGRAESLSEAGPQGCWLC